MWLTSLIAFNLGLFSSLHCIGMCGGIITILMRGAEQSSENKAGIAKYSIAYNAGRISSYSLAGLLAGLFGASLTGLTGNHNLHFWLQIFTAAILIALAMSLIGVGSFTKKMEGLGMWFWRYLQPLGRRLFPVNSPLKAWMFGLVWGWLPCGLVYSALLLSLSSGSAVGGFVVMLAFGLGTLPTMISAGYFVEYLQRFSRQKKLRYLSAALLVLMAISLPVSSWYFSDEQHSHGEHHDHSMHMMSH